MLALPASGSLPGSRLSPIVAGAGTQLYVRGPPATASARAEQLGGAEPDVLAYKRCCHAYAPRSRGDRTHTQPARPRTQAHRQCSTERKMRASLLHALVTVGLGRAAGAAAPPTCAEWAATSNSVAVHFEAHPGADLYEAQA